MIVALTHDAMYLKQQMEMYGHKIVCCENYKGAIDAVVYKGMSIVNLKLDNSNFAGNSGVLMVDCTKYNSRQINDILINRSFSAVFD